MRPLPAPATPPTVVEAKGSEYTFVAVSESVSEFDAGVEVAGMLKTSSLYQSQAVGLALQLFTVSFAYSNAMFAVEAVDDPANWKIKMALSAAEVMELPVSYTSVVVAVPADRPVQGWAQPSRHACCAAAAAQCRCAVGRIYRTKI